MKTETIVFDPDQLQLRTMTSTTSSTGVPVRLSLSTFDVPRSVTIDDVAGGGLLIRFQYIDNEQATEHKTDESLTTLVGKNSGKVLGFILGLTAIPAQQIPQRLAYVVDRELANATKDNQKLNYSLIRALVTEKALLGDEIVKRFVAEKEAIGK